MYCFLSGRSLLHYLPFVVSAKPKVPAPVTGGCACVPGGLPSDSFAAVYDLLYDLLHGLLV
jgi:hypothetical protein